MARPKRSGSFLPRSRAAGTCCSRTCPARQRPSWPARSRARSTVRRRLASSARPTSSRRTSPGLSVFDQKTRDFEFRPGPIFANVVLVDEVNRAMPKTQSALLEAMAERQVTVDGVTRKLPDPFLLLATENPIEYEGTFPLPEAQLDRFFLKTALGYPGVEDELTILEEQRYAHPLDTLGAAVTLEDAQYAPRGRPARLRRRRPPPLDRRSRPSDARRSTTSSMGASVRGSLALERAVRAWALLHGRDFVVPDGRRAPLRPRHRAPRRLPSCLPCPRTHDGLGRRDRGLSPPVPRASHPSPAPRRIRCSRGPGPPTTQEHDGACGGGSHSRQERT